MVAQVSYDAVADGSDRLRYPAGDDAHQLIANRAAAGDMAFVAGVRTQFGL